MRTTNQPQSPSSILKTLKTLHIAFCFSVFIFGAAVLYVANNATINFNDSDNIFFYIVPLFAIVGAIASQFLFKKTITRAHDKSSLSEKLTHYQSSKLIQYALVEGPAFLGIVIFLTTSNQYYLLISAVLLVLLISLRPTLSEIKGHLKLTPAQEKELREIGQ